MTSSKTKPKPKPRKAREWTAEYSGHSGYGKLYYFFEVPETVKYADTIQVREVRRRKKP